jgi:hypothetical protein
MTRHNAQAMTDEAIWDVAVGVPVGEWLASIEPDVGVEDQVEDHAREVTAANVKFSPPDCSVVEGAMNRLIEAHIDEHGVGYCR